LNYIDVNANSSDVTEMQFSWIFVCTGGDSEKECFTDGNSFVIKQLILF